MKRLFSFAACVLVAAVALAQKPVITFEKMDHDFGKINEADGRVSTIFTFKNEGMEPLVLSNVRASCGCTSPSWPRQPIEPGETANITVTYNPNGRPGRFNKSITVTSNADKPTVRLTIHGEVIPKPVKPVDNYPVKMEEISLKSNSVNFGNLIKGKKDTRFIEYANLTDKPVVLGLMLPIEEYVDMVLTLDTVKPHQTGKISAMLDAEACPLYGPISTNAILLVNGQKADKEGKENKISVSANIKEDFSQLTEEQLMQAPIVEVAGMIDAGTIVKGKKGKISIPVKNAGHNTLMFRRVVNNHKMLKISHSKGVRSGYKGEVKVEINTSNLEPGAFERRITLITNDPKAPEKHIVVKWAIK